MTKSSYTLSIPNPATQIATLASQVQENANRFMVLKDKNEALCCKNCNLLEHLSAIETTPQRLPNHRFYVSIPHM